MGAELRNVTAAAWTKISSKLSGTDALRRVRYIYFFWLVVVNASSGKSTHTRALRRLERSRSAKRLAIRSGPYLRVSWPNQLPNRMSHM